MLLADIRNAGTVCYFMFLVCYVTTLSQ